MAQHGQMETMTVREAIREALETELAADDSVFVQGIDVASRGGVFGLLEGLGEEFPDRVRNTPISEVAIVGSGLGAAMTGMRPVVEVMYSGFLGVPMDQILNQVAKLRYMTDGNMRIPLTIRTQNTSGFRAAAQHSQSLHQVLMAIPGIKVVCLSTPADAKGLLTAAIRHDDPVIVFEHAGIYDREAEAPTGEIEFALGEAAVERPGEDVTIVATQVQLWNALEAAEELAGEGVSVEVVSPRSFDPLDMDTITASVAKTGRCVVVDETPLLGGTQSDIAARIADSAFFQLDYPVKRLGVENVPIPFSPVLEDEVFPDTDDITAAVREMT